MQSLLTAILLFCSLSTARSEESSCKVEDRGKDSYRLKISDDIHAHIIFDTVLKPSDVDKENRSILQNKQGDIIGFTIRPATHTGFPCIILRLENGDVMIMEKLNSRIQRLFKKLPKGFAPDCIVLEAIEGRTLLFSSSTHWKDPVVYFRVTIAKDGRMKLQPQN